MGFGYLLFGYLTTFFLSFHSFGFLFIPVGLVLMAVGCEELRKYNRQFLWCLPVIGVAFLNSLYLLAAGFADKWSFAIPFVNETATYICTVAKDVLFLFIHAAVLWAVAKIALQVELPDISRRALRNLILTAVYYLLDILVILIPFGEEVMKVMLIVGFLLFFICIVLNTLVLLSCYRMICKQGEEDMPRKQSRFAFINRIHEKSDKAEQETQERVRAYVERKRAERMERSKNRKKK